MIEVFARLERTTDSHWLTHLTTEQLEQKQWRDVVLYNDRACTKAAGRFPAHYTKSKPKRRQKTVPLNCVKYKLTWIEG